MPRQTARSQQSGRATQARPRAKTSQSKLTSTGSPAARRASKATDVQEATRDVLYQRAAELGINGRSRMTKDALLRAIRDQEKQRSR